MVNKDLIETTPYGTRSIIGHGGEAIVYQYLSGPYEGLVGRIQLREQSVIYVCGIPKNNLYRFRSHQIAYSAFPQYNLEVVALDFNRKEMFSRFVKRSRTNIRDATKNGRKERKLTKDTVELPLVAKRIVDMMRKSGVYANSNIANVSITKDGIKFFEVDYVREEQLPDRVDPNLIAAQQLELKLEGEELQQLLADERFRVELLKKKGLEHLADFYSKEMGSTIILR